jgi:hypothetical protein
LLGRDDDAPGPIDSPGDGEGQPWTVERLREAREAHRVEHAGLRLDPEARNLRHTHVGVSDDRATWRVQRMLVDPEGLDDWVLEIEVDLAASGELGEPVLKLLRLGRLLRRASAPIPLRLTDPSTNPYASLPTA